MATLTSLPDEIICSIFRLLKSDADILRDPAFYNLTYVNNNFCLIALEIFHNQKCAEWTTRSHCQQKMNQLRKAEANLVYENHNPLSISEAYQFNVGVGAYRINAGQQVSEGLRRSPRIDGKMADLSRTDMIQVRQNQECITPMTRERFVHSYLARSKERKYAKGKYDRGDGSATAMINRSYRSV